MDLFTEYCQQASDKETSSEVPVNDDNDDDDDNVVGDDIEAQIRKEVEGLKPKSSAPRLFQKITGTNIPCMVFVRVDKSIDPVKLVHDLCVEARTNPHQRKSRWIRRMTPISQIRKTLSVDLYEFAKEVLQPHFHADDVSKKYAIRPTIRNNDSFNRDIIIRTVAAAVGQNHRVDLKNYDHMILVDIAQSNQATQSTIGMSVVGSDYDELKRFNLSEIYNPTQKPPPQNPES
ncbi:hypothetical protein UA08_04043 [Talaromyces atroroseus]|uniref:THUMP domain-containing protein n=1 Tax=Talaromyces atroroseus TaxID=1441469 RepID=A0A1Q5Q955_TALAT|nr:hypothetical protein UA08_04043 [Talaromyces atroroseus]OKL60602.1 hypothetical protein UA08_04043 [Talaromyces atroroseus]